MNRCKEILKKAISLNNSFGKFIGDANRLTDKLVELGNKPVGQYTILISKKTAFMHLLVFNNFPFKIHFYNQLLLELVLHIMDAVINSFCLIV